MKERHTDKVGLGWGILKIHFLLLCNFVQGLLCFPYMIYDCGRSPSTYIISHYHLPAFWKDLSTFEQLSLIQSFV